MYFLNKCVAFYLLFFYILSEMKNLSDFTPMMVIPLENSSRVFSLSSADSLEAKLLRSSRRWQSPGVRTQLQSATHDSVLSERLKSFFA